MSNARIEKVMQAPMPDIIVQQSSDAGRRYWIEHIQCWQLFLEKNAQYGNSIEETGVLGAVVELVAKNARLRELVLRNQEFGTRGMTAEHENSVEDVLRDLVNYGIIGLMMLRKSNWKGAEEDEH